MAPAFYMDRGGAAGRGGGLGQMQRGTEEGRWAVVRWGGEAGQHRAYYWGTGSALPAHMPGMRPMHGLLLRAMLGPS